MASLYCAQQILRYAEASLHQRPLPGLPPKGRDIFPDERVFSVLMVSRPPSLMASLAFTAKIIITSSAWTAHTLGSRSAWMLTSSPMIRFNMLGICSTDRFNEIWALCIGCWPRKSNSSQGWRRGNGPATRYAGLGESRCRPPFSGSARRPRCADGVRTPRHLRSLNTAFDRAGPADSAHA